MSKLSIQQAQILLRQTKATLNKAQTLAGQQPSQTNKRNATKALETHRETLIKAHAVRFRALGIKSSDLIGWDEPTR